MNHPIKNPGTNVLANGLDEQQIIEAVRVSGYPLQTNAAYLRKTSYELIASRDLLRGFLSNG